METVLAGQDKIILFGNPQTASAAFQQFEIPLDRRDGKISLGAQVSSASFHEKKRKSVNNEKNPIPNNSRISPASNYQPLGGMKNYSPSSEYQPLGGVKRSSPKNNSPNSEYQPFSGNRKTNVPPSPSDYQPMGARLKPNNTENKSPSSSVSQYVPRGAARIHPMSQTPILDNSNVKVDDDIVTIS